MIDHVGFPVSDFARAKTFGPPGVRAHYHPNYYRAFVLDADGHNIEAVCHSRA